MLNRVSDVLTPWTVPRILQIMEATSASRNTGGAASSGGLSTDGAADMESLLRLASQLPDVAGRVMAAPLFAQRPLVESYNSSVSLTTATPGVPSDGVSLTSITYEDARYMCTTALAVRRCAWRAESSNDDEPSTANVKACRSLPHTEPQIAAAELEEVGFAAEFSEPCICGSFPDAAAALRHVLPGADAGVSSESGGAPVQSASRRGAPDLFQGTLRSILRPPSVPRAPPLVKTASSPSSIHGGASTTSHRLHLVQPSPSAASAKLQSLVLDTTPPPSLLPIEVRGPPGHRVFDGGCVAYSFSANEKEELLDSLCAEPPPLRVFSRVEVEARCRPGGLNYDQASAPLSAAAGPATATTGHVSRDGLPPSTDRGAPGSRVDNDDGWSTSTGWSSRSSSEPRRTTDNDKAKEKASKSMKRFDTVNDETRPESRAVAPDMNRPTSEVAPATHPPGTASTTRTWVNDDDDLVLENGHITIRKKKMRPVRDLSATRPLPTVVSGSLVNPSLMTTVVSAASADQRHFTSSATHGADYEVATGDDTAEDSAPHGKTRVAGAKRSRDSTAASAPADNQATVRPPEPPQKMKSAGVATELKCSTAPAATSDEVSMASLPINTKSVVRLSQEEVLEFIESLRVSETLRRALLVGVAATSVAEGAPVNSPGTVSEVQSEKDESLEEH
ncbi:conserved hypothetical protein [Leishmania braziliensis MHOM/BR/75/M2904]|uniref:Uncharacterized protein n=2 Tax=Leishmania braziliensis TaxID=5660 RepID=A4HL97_LEIBR|nr:conserved hypothetical protein [Leishmania braziliensis MHOM/BR/75/M2904]CAJ2479291.1 unnamed protein product [Leishmania braziliensis]CAM40591.2 conserved hypothetical protein [Leishmania braziliensis MHOM/BR/75/M2904]SYZ68998.1 hypothetical_protein [Leishmania braziliensis MHOM/BR/75/M2904]